MNLKHATLTLILTVGLSLDAGAEVSLQKQPAQTPIRQLPVPALAGPRTVPNAIETMELYMKNASGGTIVRFKIGGISTNLNAKCVVQVTFERAPNAINPKPFSNTKEYTLATIPTTLETESMNVGGDWTFKVKPVRECTGKEYVVNFKIPFGAQESEPVIYGVSASAIYFTFGMSGNITIVGGGDLKDCKVELYPSGLTIAGPLTAAGTKIIGMNGQLEIKEPFTIPPPPNYVKDPNINPIHFFGKAWVKAISGCTVKPADMEGKIFTNFWIDG